MVNAVKLNAVAPLGDLNQPRSFILTLLNTQGMKNSIQITSVKCPQCNLVNFATAEVCKRCGTALNMHDDASEGGAEPQQKAQAETPATALVPCPDCEHFCSRMAEACPNCGRAFQPAPTPKRSSIGKVIAVGGGAVLCVCVVIVVLVTRRVVAVQAALESGQPANAGVSSTNREPARAAMNAVGEIQSVTSVGTNFMQYAGAIQSAKVKLDAAMRDFNPRDPADQEIKRQLEEALYCYVDARDAWAEFIEHDKYGYGLLDQDNKPMKDLAQKYGFEPFTTDSMPTGKFDKGTVLQTIWARASQTLDSVSEHLR